MNGVRHAMRIARRYANGGSDDTPIDPVVMPGDWDKLAPGPNGVPRLTIPRYNEAKPVPPLPESPDQKAAPVPQESFTEQREREVGPEYHPIRDPLGTGTESLLFGMGQDITAPISEGPTVQNIAGAAMASPFMPPGAEGILGTGKALAPELDLAANEFKNAYKTHAGTGSNPGGFFSGFSDGIDRYVKPMDEDRARNEVLANRFYEMWGVPVAHNELTMTPNGKYAVASHIIPNAQHLGNLGEIAEEGGKLIDLHDHFAADAYLANWDAVGLNRDNMLVDGDGRVWRIDHGGALEYRAQGEPKGAKFGSTVGELTTMREQGEAGQVFKDVELNPNNQTAQKIAATTDDQIRALVKQYGPKNITDNHLLAEKLIKRRDDLTLKYGLKGGPGTSGVSPSPLKGPGFSATSKYDQLLAEGIEEYPANHPEPGWLKDEIDEDRRPSYQRNVIHPQSDDEGHEVYIKKPTIPGVNKTGGITFIPGQEVSQFNLSGKPFHSWKPAGKGTWSQIKDTPLNEPPIPNGNFSTGIIIEEPDGRIWISHPTNQFGGYEATFPKGRMEFGFSPQQNAIKETYEETGLRAQITGLLGDFKKTTGTTRYYLGRRLAGSPSDMGWESQGMSVLYPEDVKERLNMAPDHKIIDAYMEAKAKNATDVNQLSEAPGWLKSGQGYPDSISEDDWKSLEAESDRFIPGPAQYDAETGLPTSMPSPPKIDKEDKPVGPPLKLMQLNKTHSPEQIVQSVSQISKASAEANSKLVTPKQTIKIQQLVDGLSPSALASHMLGMPYKQQVNVKSWMTNTDKYNQVNHALETLAEGKSKYTAQDIQEHEENKHQHELYKYEMDQGIPSGDQQSTWGKKPTTKTVINPKTGQSTQQKGAEVQGQFIPQHIFDAIKPYNYGTHSPINKGKILSYSDFPNAKPEDVKKYNRLQLWHSGEAGEHGSGSYVNQWSDPLTYKGYTYNKEQAIFLSESKSFSGNFGGGNVLPYVVRGDARVGVVHFPEAKYPNDPYKDSASYSGHTVAQLTKAGRAMKYDMLIIKNMNDGHVGMAQYVVLNPSILRAPKAKFDPQAIKSMKPLSGIVGIPAAGAATYGISNQDQTQYYRGGAVKSAMRVARGYAVKTGVQ